MCCGLTARTSAKRPVTQLHAINFQRKSESEKNFKSCYETVTKL